MTLKIFVSHSMNEEDKHILDDLKKQMPRGVSIFVAEWNPTPGKPLKEKIRRALLDCDVLLAMLTKDGARSEWVNQEIGFAYAKGKDIIPIREEGVGVKGFVDGLEWVTLDRLDPKVAIDKVASHLNKLHSRKIVTVRKQEEAKMWTLIALGIMTVVVLVFFGWAISKSK